MPDNEVPIKVERDLIQLSTRYLGTSEAYVWVGLSFGPLDNDDVRVLETRDLMHRYYPYIPYGMMVGNVGSSGWFIMPLIDELANGYYLLRVDLWPEGIYRFNYHSRANVVSPSGFPLTGKRDGHVSWSRWWSDDTPQPVKDKIRDFVYVEPNRAGHCFRVLIDRDRSIKPFGNLDIKS